jgi:predicted LPLAT superfamily acyltransferase
MTEAEVVAWINEARAIELVRLLAQLNPKLAPPVAGATDIDPEQALRFAAAVLRGADVGKDLKDEFEQFACEVEDVLSRVGASRALTPRSR